MTEEQKRIIYEHHQLDKRLKMHEIQKEFEQKCRWDRLLGFTKNLDKYCIMLESMRAVREYLKKRMEGEKWQL